MTPAKPVSYTHLPYTTSLTPEDVNFFQVNDANGRGMRADASMRCV